MLKLIAAALTFIFILTAAVTSPSQEQSQLPAETKDSNIFIEATGKIGIDELKRYRTAAENASDLTEEVKKAVRSSLDRAIIFREEEAQLRQEIEDVKLQIQAAPKRIQAIESELEEPLSVSEDVSENASDMKPTEIEAQLHKVKTNLLEKTADLKKLTDQLNDPKNQPSELHQEVVRLKQRLNEIGLLWASA